MSPESTGYTIPNEDFKIEGGEIVVDRTLKISVRYKPDEFRVIVGDSFISGREESDLVLTPDAKRIMLVTPPDSDPKDDSNYYEEDFYHMQRFRMQLGFLDEGILKYASLPEIDMFIRAGVIIEDSEVGLAYSKTLEESKLD